VVTNELNPLCAGVSISKLIIGSRHLPDYEHRNPHVHLEPTSFTHSIAIISSMARFFAASFGVKIDLTGQFNAETAGGLGDFLRVGNFWLGGPPA
jgi:acetyl-CoA hydrolase